MNRLKELRTEKGYTQIELSKIINIDQSNYSKVERGTGDINVNLVKQLSKLYNISADYILELTDEKRPLS